MADTQRLGRILCIFWPSTQIRQYQEIGNHKEAPLPRKLAMERILKHMTRTTGNIKSATIVTKKAIHVLIVQTRTRKRTTRMKSPSPVNKLKSVLKSYPKTWRRIRRPSLPYKLRYQISKSTNPTYQNQMESHTHINSFYLRTNTMGWNLKLIYLNILSSTET